MYYDHDLAESDRKKEEIAQKKPQQSKSPLLLPNACYILPVPPPLTDLKLMVLQKILEYFRRVIVHPSFMNCSYAEAEKALAKMDQGDAIFRPSSKVRKTTSILIL